MQKITLCEFVTKYGLREVNDTLVYPTYNLNDCVGEIIVDDSLFNIYGMMYAMREILFLFNPHDIQKMAEYMFEFGLKNPHALSYNLFHPNSTIPTKLTSSWQNPYYKQTEFVVSESKTIQSFKMVLDRRIIERHYDNYDAFSAALENISIEVFGNPFMMCPVIESIEKASSIRKKMMSGDINITHELSITKELTQKHNMLYDIVCGIDSGDYQTRYKTLTRNLLCIFNMDEFEKQRERIRSILVMNPLPTGFELIFPSWNDFTNWLKINQEDVRNILHAYARMNEHDISNITLVSSLTPRQLSLFTALKFILGDYHNNPVRAGMSLDEINKNYNRQKIYNNVESVLKVISGVNA